MALTFILICVNSSKTVHVHIAYIHVHVNNIYLYSWKIWQFGRLTGLPPVQYFLVLKMLRENVVGYEHFKFQGGGSHTNYKFLN